MLSSPRRPSNTMRIFSSAEKCRRVARRMSLMVSSAGCFSGPDFCLIFAPCGYDDPEILPSCKPQIVSKALTADTRAVRRPDFQVERLVQGLDEIEWSITRYLKRANVLLDVSRITSGKLALERLPVDVCEVAREVIENFLPLRQHAGSDLTLDLSVESVVVTGDRLAIEEILDNLVSNAIKYGANKPILLRIGVDEEQHCALIRVSDNGSGISADDQARIFERFERAVHPGEHLHGFGVGLWIVQQLCQGMEGFVRVDSTPGQGSTFSVTLPLQSPKDLR